MRLRHKLLLLLLGMSLTPMLLLRVGGERALRGLGQELGQQSEEVLLQRTRQELRRMVEDHAVVLDRERRLLNATVQLQAIRVAESLARPQHAVDGESLPDSAFFISGSFMGRMGPMRMMGRMGALRSMDLSGPDGAAGRQPVDLPGVPPDYAPDLTRAGLVLLQDTPGARADAWRLGELTAPFRMLAGKTSGLVLRQETVLRSGVYAIYPGVDRLPAGYQPATASWAARAMAQGPDDGPVWTFPTMCPMVQQYVLAVSAPVVAEGDAGGPRRVLGATSMVVPTALMVHNNEHLRHVSPRTASYLVRLPDDDKDGLEILAHSRAADSAHTSMAGQGGPDLLGSANTEELHGIIDDLRCGQTGLRELEQDGEPCLWAYAPVGELGSALVLVVPMADILRDPEAAEHRLVGRIAAELDHTKVYMLGVMGLVAVFSFLAAGRMTRDLQKLTTANHRLAQGDFDVRVDIGSGDEVGELGKAFNETVPALRERMQIRRSLDLAREIQQGLLPASPPHLHGLDVASRGLFCEAVGGDYHGFMDCCCGLNGLVAAVGDVSGHGISAALLMASARAMLRSRLEQPGSLAQAVTDVNGLLANDTYATGHFMTLFVLALCDGATWVRAGHDPALLYDPERDGFEELGGDGPALGLFHHHAYSQYARPGLRPGMFVCLATDGLWEARNAAGEFYGKARLKDALRRNAGLTAAGLVEAVLEDLRVFLDRPRLEGLEDDVTVVVIKAKAEEGGV